MYTTNGPRSRYDGRVPHIKENLWSFYVEGREGRLIHCDEDILALVTASELPVLQACRRVAEEAARAVATNVRTKRKWIDEHLDDFKQIAKDHGSCDQEAAFAAWVDGRTDKLALKLQKRCVDDLYDQTFGDDDDDDDDDEDEDEDDDDEESEDEY
jgi:hypothetical protein